MSECSQASSRRWRAVMTASVVALVAAVSAAPMLAQQALAPQPPAQRASSIVVLDGSNSMNARLPNDKNLKFVTVRDALRASLPKLAPGSEIGLAAFGARRASDCTDAEVIVTPSADGSRVLAALERFQPRGFSPVVLALRTAAKALPQDGAKASIVLVLDDLASCRGEDPCAVAAELKRQNAALSIHVVVLGPRPVDLPVLACMVKQTGGQLFQVADGAGVAPAIEEVIQLVGFARGIDRGEPSRTPSAASPIIESQRAGSAARAPTAPAIGIDPSQPGLHLTARLAEGTPTLLLPIEWRISRADSPRATDTGATIEQRASEPLVQVTAPALSRVLANGRYEVEATAGLVSARRMIEITAQGPTPIVLDLNAALLSIAAPQTKGAAPPADATVTVLAVGASGDGSEARGAPLWIGRGGVHDLVVPAGSYRVKAAAGLASAERVVSVGQGVVSDVEMPLGAGRLVVEVRAGSGQEDANPPQILIEADDPESTGGRRELFRAAERRLEMTVPAGTYLLTVRRDAAELRERLLIRAGETLSRPVTLPIARIRLVSRIGNGMPAGLPVAYRIERLDTQSRPIQRWEAEPVVDLSPGRYRFEVRLGAQNAVAARDLEVRAGSGEVRIDLDTGAGGIQLKLDGAIGGLGLGEVYWQVFNDKGESVWRTGLLEPLMALGAGRYRVRADVRERVLERTFDVRAGDSKVIEVGG